MDLALPAGLIPVLLLVLAAEFVNGWTDAPNAIATVVSTRVLTPSVAVVMATGLNILGAMSGTAVAATIGKGIVRADAIDAITIAAALVAIVVWGTLAALRRLPTRESHALRAALGGRHGDRHGLDSDVPGLRADRLGHGRTAALDFLRSIMRSA